MQFDEQLIQRLHQAAHIVFFTGAGASTESGVPTFRDNQNSFWVDFDVNTFATESGFCANPSLVWQWYQGRRRQAQTLLPNPAHRVMAAWQDKTKTVNVITQNIDGFHQRAGSRSVIELHGNINRYKCLTIGHPFEGTAIDEPQPPRCRQCGNLVRPDVVWFGDELPAEAFAQAEQLSMNCDVFVCIGSSLEVYPACTLPIKASQCGAYVVQVNPLPTALDGYAKHNLKGYAGEILPQLWQTVWQEPLPGFSA